jgi:hypothetical protein
MKFPEAAYHKYLYTIAILLPLFIQPACRKTDILTTNLNDQTKSFFKSHPSNHPIVQKIAAYFSKKNEADGIASIIAYKYGIPYWNKTLLFEENNTARSTTNEPAMIAYIPLLQNNEISVKAQLTVRLNTADTSFEILTAGQYAQFGFMPNDTMALNGLKVFTLFAAHDRNIFGYTKFNITDNRILLGQNTFPVDMNRHYQVTLTTAASAVSGRVLAAPAPLPHSSCLIVKDYEAAGYTVTYTQIGQVCVVSSYGLNDDFGGDTGGGSDGSGGSGGGSGGNPTGWVPVPDEGVFPRNPCEVVDSLLRTSSFRNHLKDLRDSTILNYEKGISFTNPFIPSLYNSNYYSGQNSSDSLTVNVLLSSPTDGVMHNHYNHPSRLHNFSAEDIYKIAYYWSTGKITNFKTFTYSVVTDSTAYLLMITDSIKFINFAQTWFDNKEHFIAFARHLYKNYGYGENGNSILQDEINFRMLYRLRRLMEVVLSYSGQIMICQFSHQLK